MRKKLFGGYFEKTEIPSLFGMAQETPVRT
jgi:hypothetical protein